MSFIFYYDIPHNDAVVLLADTVVGIVSEYVTRFVHLLDSGLCTNDRRTVPPGSHAATEVGAVCCGQ